jgi:hypothetical protein
MLRACTVAFTTSGVLEREAQEEQSNFLSPTCNTTGSSRLTDFLWETAVAHECSSGISARNDAWLLHKDTRARNNVRDEVAGVAGDGLPSRIRSEVAQTARETKIAGKVRANQAISRARKRLVPLQSHQK